MAFTTFVKQFTDQKAFHVDLGNKMLAVMGEDACRDGYGTTSPEWVGIAALDCGDINEDGTLN